MEITKLKDTQEKKFKQIFGNSIGYIHLKNDDYFWFILETQTEFNYGNRNYIEPISKDHMKILWDCYNLIIKESRIDFFW